jgi:hypothetical protein
VNYDRNIQQEEDNNKAYEDDNNNDSKEEQDISINIILIELMQTNCKTRMKTQDKKKTITGNI